MKNLTVVTDPGIDDLVALALLYKLSPRSKINLMATFGNASEEITARNVKEFVSFVAPSWEFTDGSNLPLNGKVEHKWPDYFHGDDGAWGVHPEVNISNIQSLKSDPDNPGVISLAPLTDAYKLCKKTKIRNMILMGGAFGVEGNETKYAETNIAFDPDSAHLFFNEFSNIKVKVVPLDVTRKVFWSLKQVNGIPETNKVNKWLKELLLTWFDKYDHNREKDFNLHDPLAVYLSQFPNETEWATSGVEVLIKGEMRGRTVFKNSNLTCEIAVSLKNPAAIADSIFEKVFGSSAL